MLLFQLILSGRQQDEHLMEIMDLLGSCRVVTLLMVYKLQPGSCQQPHCLPEVCRHRKQPKLSAELGNAGMSGSIKLAKLIATAPSSSQWLPVG